MTPSKDTLILQELLRKKGGRMKTTRTQVTWRKAGEKKPANTVVVARPSKWGNPFKVSDYGQERAVEMFADWIRQPEQAEYRERVRRDLQGKALACYCPAHKACHADVLVKVADE